MLVSLLYLPDEAKFTSTMAPDTNVDSCAITFADTNTNRRIDPGRKNGLFFRLLDLLPKFLP